MKQRIEYIDLMKGVCITLVVMSHSGIVFEDNIDHILRVFRIPLYFFLSGLFFKRYNGFCDFFFRKFNKLIIPLFFFAYIPYGLLAPIFIADLNIKKIILMGLMPYNEPLWFLRSLFITYIIAYFLSGIHIKYRLTIIIVSSIFFPYLSLYLHKYNEVFPCLHYSYQMITSIIALPFFCTASFLNNNNFLKKTYKHSYIIMGILFTLPLLCLTRTGIDYRTAQYGNNFIYMYIGAFCGIYIVWGVCYLIRYVPYFSYIGRYSLIVLGTHAPIIVCFQVLGFDKYISFLLTMILMPPIIYLFFTCFPYFTAQKDLINYANGKITFNRIF